MSKRYFFPRQSSHYYFNNIDIKDYLCAAISLDFDYHYHHSVVHDDVVGLIKLSRKVDYFFYFWLHPYLYLLKYGPKHCKPPVCNILFTAQNLQWIVLKSTYR